MKHIKLFSLLFTLLLGFSSNAWAWDPHFYLIGDPVRSWDHTNDYFVNSVYTDGQKFYIQIYVAKDQCYGFHNGTNRYAPATDHAVSGEGDYDHSGNAWQYTGKSGLVCICLDENSGSESNRDWYPYVWTETPNVRLKHTWNGSDWTYSDNMTNNEDGTYTLYGTYSGSSNGYNASGKKDCEYILKPTIIGNPSQGDNCKFVWNATDNTLKITKITSGTMPAIVAGYTSAFTTFSASNNWQIASGDVQAYKAAVSNNEVVLNELTGIIPANTGVVLASTTAEENFTITYTDQAATADVTGNQLKANLVSSSKTELLTANQDYNAILYLSKTYASFIQLADGGTLPAQKAYLPWNITKSAPTRIVFTPTGGIVTGVETLSDSSVKGESQKMLVNGRLVIKRGERMYDLNGRMTK